MRLTKNSLQYCFYCDVVLYCAFVTEKYGIKIRSSYNTMCVLPEQTLRSTDFHTLSAIIILFHTIYAE